MSVYVQLLEVWLVFENRPISCKLLPVELNQAEFRPPWGRKRVYVQLLALWTEAKFHGNMVNLKVGLYLQNCFL